ncbi:type III restriction protein res subunit [Desulfotomaculum nigrificans CO-1-SRB]|uniref:Type III restriction protein res subunit n=1 Tax=Desulfotomaculum nigrificans (strain DSM 14880 / VKM B-2319 / CO-1-SRB) TaxID=868595 RepID=F6B881_DESCC|nr:DEAD/DEAH box helicase family protein [Desulfotomaculum nigrificans]AEF93526.1 type III restriction protein res subunit [Desulfotomaculum nigrificans CO-1-SRB]
MARRTRATSRKVSTAPSLRFDQRLVLNQYLLNLFEVTKLEDLAQGMKGPEWEGLDENNISRFYHHLTNRLYDRAQLPKDLLLTYDQNIVRHTLAIRGKRERPITWKYFQYLALLFTEIYLDRYFRDPEKLLADLNEWVERFNAGVSKGDKINPYALEDLTKLAFWNATGSGKTLLMHVNILQYRHYLALHGREKELNRIILLTPNEGLSRQHEEEFALSGLPAQIFTKDGAGLYKGQYIEIIDIHKLKDEMGEKTVAVEAFEGNNLVLVDEGHRGSSGEDWKTKRDKLCAQGFSFEYSATFGQAMKAANKPALTQEYAKCILFDYSYKYFYRDGYGKDYQILNLADDHDEEIRLRYLTACLVTFYQQLRLFRDKQREFAPYLLEKPLLVFVGSKVTAVRSENKRKVSDVVDILLFLNDFIGKPFLTQRILKRLLENHSDLPDHKGRDIFTGAFSYLIKQGFTPETLYQDILKILFNAQIPGTLHVERFKQTGEIGLRIANNEYFGVINVGDDSELAKLCAENGLHTTALDFGDSLFRTINDKNSQINILIGSKKFSEGWNSWRVSTMGLMNVGQNEGSEIIQLFGRGVRLKGKDFSLKRTVLGPGTPDYINKVETLNVFGIRADYMKQFQEYLEEEGLPKDHEKEEIILPVIRLTAGRNLKYLKLKDGLNFKKHGPNPVLGQPNKMLLKRPVVVDWYPKLQAISSGKATGDVEIIHKHSGKFTAGHLSLLNWENIYFELQHHKNERGWYNLSISRQMLRELFQKPDWYKLYIPKAELEFTDFARVRRWQEIAVTLLKKYCERYYNYHKGAWEGERMELVDLEEYSKKLAAEGKSGNFFDEYKFRISKDQEDLIHKLIELKKAISDGIFHDFSFGRLDSIIFDRHLYKPLIHLTGDTVEVTPVPLNQGEKNFVKDLRNYYQMEHKFFKENELYLLRNQAKGRGIGFFEANNFYPDFILWLVTKEKQYITFVDPKGLRNTDGPKDPKVEFCHTIKDIEKRLGDPAVVLNSFIISQTPHNQISWWQGDLTEVDFNNQYHVLFPIEGDTSYIRFMLAKIIN